MRHLSKLDPRGRGNAAVVTLSWTYASGHQIPAHFHAEDQVVYAESGVMRELILRSCTLGRLRRSASTESHLLALLRDELACAPAMPMDLPTVRDPRAKIVADALLADPADRRPLDRLCAHAGASKRTLERTFSRETGMTFAKWRQRLSLVHGMRLVAMGAKVTSAAFDAGYDSPSAFIAMFRRAVGSTPARWLRESTKRVDHA